jgi:hypothetical protein
MIFHGESIKAFTWDITTGKLRINTPRLSMTFQDGAVVFLGDNRTGEIIQDTDISINKPTVWDEIGISAYTAGGAGQPHYVPTRAKGVFTESGPVGTLTFTETGGVIHVYKFEIAGDDILLTQTGTIAGTGYYIDHTTILINNYVGPGYIMPPTRVSRTALNIDKYANTAPPGTALPIVIEGNNSVIGLWNENTKMQRIQARAVHYQNSYDYFLLWSYVEPIEDDATNCLTSTNGPWRFTCQPDWLAAVKRWRELFEAVNSDAEYLWNNACEWVRDIHCVYSRNVGAASLAKWDTIAGLIPNTERILYYGYANNSGTCVVWGDNDYLWDDLTPTDADLAYWATKGYNFVPFGYTQTLLNLYTNETYESDRMPTRLPAGWNSGLIRYDMPTGPMTQAEWEAYWDGSMAVYSANYWCHHPANQKVIDYVTYNYPDWCNKNPVSGKQRYKGGYWDILGADKDAAFKTAGIRFYNGKSFLLGTKDLVASLYDTYPIMSEEFKVDLMPYIFFCWHGYYDYMTITGRYRTVLLGEVTVTVDATAKTFTRSSGSYIDDGVIVGGIFTTAGFLNANNNGNKNAVTAVSDLVVTCGYATLTDEAVPRADTTFKAPIHINHPILAALTGSYMWWQDTRPMLTGSYAFHHPQYSALLGSLPEFIMVGDYLADALAAYSVARAQLFCDYEMYNDLPDVWGDPTVNLAWYRTNDLSGRMIKFVDNGDGTYSYFWDDEVGGSLLTYPLPA